MNQELALNMLKNVKTKGLGRRLIRNISLRKALHDILEKDLITNKRTKEMYVELLEEDSTNLNYNNSVVERFEKYYEESLLEKKLSYFYKKIMDLDNNIHIHSESRYIYLINHFKDRLNFETKLKLSMKHDFLRELLDTKKELKIIENKIIFKKHFLKELTSMFMSHEYFMGYAEEETNELLLSLNEAEWTILLESTNLSNAERNKAVKRNTFEFFYLMKYRDKLTESNKEVLTKYLKLKECHDPYFYLNNHNGILVLEAIKKKEIVLKDKLLLSSSILNFKNENIKEYKDLNLIPFPLKEKELSEYGRDSYLFDLCNLVFKNRKKKVSFNFSVLDKYLEEILEIEELSYLIENDIDTDNFIRTLLSYADSICFKNNQIDIKETLELVELKSSV